jgi:hypothetical protein
MTATRQPGGFFIPLENKYLSGKYFPERRIFSFEVIIPVQQ